MPRLTANGIELEFESFGRRSDPAVLLVMGLGMQMLAWPESLCHSLAKSGYQVIRFDNRDVGLSQRMSDSARVNLPAAAMRYLLHLPVAAPYTLETMAEDGIGLLDALGIERAHLVGASLGGMVAQSAAARHPERCLSLVSIMSSSGDRRLPKAQLKILRLLLSRPKRGDDREAWVGHYLRMFRAIGSPGFPTPPELMEARVRMFLERSHYPAGTLRQILAILASGDRSAQLRRIRAPTLVLHGKDDPLVPVAHGVDCARKIPGARLELIAGMGHDLAPGLLPILQTHILGHFVSIPVEEAASERP